MNLGFRSGIRHPLYPDLAATPAVQSKGRCSALAGTFAELAHAAAAARPRRAVFVLVYAGQPFLSDSQRDELWHWFQVPVFALLLDPSGRLLGYECQAQRGLHLSGPASDADAHSGIPGTMDSTPCPCGRPGDRLRPA